MSSPFTKVPIYSPTDYLGYAANAKHEANWYLKNGNLDKAWQFYQKQQYYYSLHIDSRHPGYGYTPEQAISLLSTVNESMANVLRLEGKHRLALMHMIYCVAGSNRSKKRHVNKLPAYFKRAKYAHVSLDDVYRLISKQKPLADLEGIKDAMEPWN